MQAAEVCAREPIHVPGTIQAHGGLLVLDPADLRVLQASETAFERLGWSRDAGTRLGDWDGRLAAALAAWRQGDDPTFLSAATIAGRPAQFVAHAGPQGILLEFEETAEGSDQAPHVIYAKVRAFASAIEPLNDPVDLSRAVATQVRALTGFDRVLVYRFGDTWDGTVIAEDGNGTLPSYLDLRFPASDIPAQARALYHRNRIRSIPDADYRPVPIVPAASPIDGAPLDLSLSTLRGVSPVHLQYMRNMGTAASLSISLLVDGALWGLISCHSATRRSASPAVRAACDLLAQMAALQIGAKTRVAEAAELIALKQVESELLTRLSHAGTWYESLTENDDAWLRLTGAAGVAICVPDRIVTVGQTPPREVIDRLAAWLGQGGPGQQGDDDLFASDCLTQALPWAESCADVASGLLAISISQIYPSYVLWFRPEVVRTLRWGGDPSKEAPGADGTLHPRASFAQWKEQVRLRSTPWRPAEIRSARDFRNAIVNFVLRRAEERAALTDELERSNRELESFSYSVSHDLRAPFRHIVGYAQLLRERAKSLDDKSAHYLASIVESALSAGHLVDELLHFSQLGRASLRQAQIDMDKLLHEVRRSLESEVQGRSIEWQVGSLPVAWGDGAMVRQALLNLVGNAVKYTRQRERAVISIQGSETPDATLYRIGDNGVGFDMAYAGKLFGVFQRLHSIEEFEGVGIGLALTQRIVERHGGRIEAEGRLGDGATFTFTLPKRKAEEGIGGSATHSSG